MSTEILERSHSQTTSQMVPSLIASSTLAFAAISSPLVSNTLPTYIPNAPSELISLFFAPEHQNINIQKLIYSIRTYSTYEKNWDGYEGVPPKDETIRDTINFLKHLPKDIALPYAGLSGDGEINLFWDKSGIFIDIGFSGDNKFSYFARDSKGKEFSGNYISISSNLPTDIINLIKK